MINTWKIAVSFMTFSFFSLAMAAESATESLAEGMVNPGYHEKPDWFKPSFLDIREDIDEASGAGKRVLLYFYQDGCPYCAKLLETNLSQRDIVEKTRSGFDVIAVNIWGDREVTGLDGAVLTEKQFAEQLKVMYTPTLLFFDEDGQVVLRLNGYYPPDKFTVALDYVAGRHEREGTIRDYVARVNPPAARGELHREDATLASPYDLSQRAAERPLLVLFEQSSCPACDELHGDIFKRPESREQLKRFDVVVLDMWSDEPVVTPEGNRLSAREWARKLGVQYAPSMVFFSRDNQEVFRAEAWLRAFHIQSVLDYVASGAYREQPNFQRYISARADRLEAQGVHVDLME